jgi:hypothetical protein
MNSLRQLSHRALATALATIIVSGCSSLPSNLLLSATGHCRVGQYAPCATIEGQVGAQASALKLTRLNIRAQLPELRNVPN